MRHLPRLVFTDQTLGDCDDCGAPTFAAYQVVRGHDLSPRELCTLCVPGWFGPEEIDAADRLWSAVTARLGFGG